ncbi:MAG TPA: 4-alpha-glucanotransferase [Bryobacteraceae bacterium]|nr:4-alpha-glucanotransferase [Bryobacteraceae bacterium]
MAPDSFEELLDRAAASRGIDPGFWDIWGQYHHTTPEAKRAILGAMGLPAGTEDELRKSMAAAQRREWGRLLPPVVVTGESDAVELALNVPAESLGTRAHITVTPEEGAASEFDVALWELPQDASAEMDGRTFVRKLARLPLRLPLGYHQVTAVAGAASAKARYIVTPERAWTDPHLGRGGRAAGVAISLYGVRSERNWGCGDFRDLLDVVDWAADEMEVSFIGLNPLHAIHNRRPFNTSPYLPNCIFYQNFIYLDIEAIEDFAGARRARELRESAWVKAEIEALRGSPYVEYERVAALKLRFLKLMFAAFLRERRRGSARARDFDAFVNREGDLLEKFATYSALDEWLHARDGSVWIWTQWPAAYQDPASAETQAFRKKHWRSVMLWQYIQWQLDIQLRRAQQKARGRQRSIGLYHDLALATDRFGSDLWGHREFFVAGARVGSPPDDFTPDGQDWAFPPPNAERHREDGYRLFSESIRKNCRHGGALRLDHAMRLFRLYWIPESCDAAHGAYVRERNEDLVRVLALESVRNRVVIVGEDLGTVEPAIRETLSRYGVLGYRLFYFEKNGDGGFKRPEDYTAQALVSSTTHDLPTLAGFWIAADVEARRAVGMLDEAGWRAALESRAAEKQKMLDALFAEGLIPPDRPRLASAYRELTGELHSAVVGFLAGAASQLLAINQEDLTKETDQQNLPGTTWQYPNWGRKMRYSLEQLRTDHEALDYTAMLRHWIAATGRRNRAE